MEGFPIVLAYLIAATCFNAAAIFGAYGIKPEADKQGPVYAQAKRLSFAVFSLLAGMVMMYLAFHYGYLPRGLPIQAHGVANLGFAFLEAMSVVMMMSQVIVAIVCVHHIKDTKHCVAPTSDAAEDTQTIQPPRETA